MSAPAGLTESSDEALFARVARGEMEAFAEFYDRHEGVLFGVALRILEHQTDAEDVLQEAAVLMWERAPGYNPALGKPLSWAVTLVRNKAIDRIRSAQRRSDLLGALEAGRLETPGYNPVPDSSVVLGEAGELVRGALAKLPSEQREAIELAFFGGLSQSEIATRLQQPLGTIKARIRRGMLAMRDGLGGVW